jgi:dihydrolipoamide dehydrogenase
LNYGCIPSNALITTGHLLDRIAEAPKMGVEISGVKVHLDQLISWKAGIVKTLTTGIGQLLKANGVTVFSGKASLQGFAKGPNKEVKLLSIDPTVDPYDGSSTGPAGSARKSETLQARKVILATGSTSVQIPSFVFDGKFVLNSKQALDVTKIPKKIVVIGGGFIGLEIGTFFSKLGTAVTILEATSGLLPGTDRDCVDVVSKKLTKKGVKIHLETKASGVELKGQGENASVLVRGESAKGEKLQWDADWVLVTVGRKPRTEGLGLENVGLSANARGFLEVNDHLETAVPGIYAIGDIVQGPMLAHKASNEGLVAVENIKNPQAKMSAKALPWAIFVDPEIASVGHTVESATAVGWDPVVGKCPFVANGRALTTGESEGFVKIIADRKTDLVIGAHLVGPEVSNLVAELALAIEMGATTQDIARTIHAHPTLPETLVEAAESVHGMAVHFFERKARKPMPFLSPAHGHS